MRKIIVFLFLSFLCVSKNYAAPMDGLKICIINGDNSSHDFTVHHSKIAHLKSGTMSCFYNDSPLSPNMGDLDTMSVRVDNNEKVNIWSTYGDIALDSASTQAFLAARLALSFPSLGKLGKFSVTKVGKAAHGCYVEIDDDDSDVKAAAEYAACAALDLTIGPLISFGEKLDRLTRGYPLENLYDPKNALIRRFYVNQPNGGTAFQMLSSEQNTFPDQWDTVYIQYPFEKRNCVKTLKESGERSYQWKIVPDAYKLFNDGGEIGAKKRDTYFADIAGGVNTIQYYIDDYMCNISDGKFGTGLAFGNGAVDGIYLCYNPNNIPGNCTIPQRQFQSPYLPFGDIGDLTVKNDTVHPVKVYVANNDKTKVIGEFNLDAGAYSIIKKDKIIASLNNSPAGQLNVYIDTTFKTPIRAQTQCLYSQPYDSRWAPTAVRVKYTMVNDGKDVVSNPSYGPYSCQVLSSSEGIYGRIRDAKCTAESIRGNLPRILGYYANWSDYKNFSADKISCDVDEIIYAFAQIGDCAGPETNYATESEPTKCAEAKNQDGSVKHTGIQDYKLHSTDKWSDFFAHGGLGNIGFALSKGKPVYLSIAGWSLSRPLRDAIKPEHRQAFVDSIIRFMVVAQLDAKNYAGVESKFSGVDVDWEPNANNWTLPNATTPQAQLTRDDLENYYQFLVSLKAALTDARSKGVLANDRLKIAFTANPIALRSVSATYESLYWLKLSKVVDGLNLMTYDYHGPSFGADLTAGYTNFNAPWDARTDQPQSFSEDVRTQFNTKAAIDALLAEGIVSTKIGFGLAAYGRVYPLADNATSKAISKIYFPYDSSKNSSINTINGAPTQNDMTYSYKQIITGKYYRRIGDTTKFESVPINAEFKTSDFHSASEDILWQIRQSFWLGTYLPTKQPIYIDTDDYDSARWKMEFAQKLKLGSVMIWDLWGDLNPYQDSENDMYYKKSIVRGLVDVRK